MKNENTISIIRIVNNTENITFLVLSLSLASNLSNKGCKTYRNMTPPIPKRMLGLRAILASK